jgi:hypothetical protein
MSSTEPRKVLATILSLLLVLAATTAAFADTADQDVEFGVYPVGLSIDVQDHLNLEWIPEGGASGLHHFGMNIHNSTASGWEVTVSGPDLGRYGWTCLDPTDWEDGQECHEDDWVLEETEAVSVEALKVTSGDVNVKDSPISPSTPTEVTVTNGGTLLMSGTAYRHHDLDVNEPHPAVRVDLDGLTGGDPHHLYRTTLTYTITPN